MQRRKSRFWLFIWSLIPGAGEMYMGFMKMGFSLMIGFMGLIAIAALTNLGVLSIFPTAMWFYSFFHANNLASIDEQTFCMMEDHYLFGMDNWSNMEKLNSNMEGKKKSFIAAILILIGGIMLWEAIFNLLCDIFGWDNVFLRQMYYFVRDDLPRFVIGIAIIWVGVVMIRGKKEDNIVEEQKQEDYVGQNPQQDIDNEQNPQ